MSELERRTFIRAFLSAPQELYDDELEQLELMAHRETLRRSASRVEWRALFSSIGHLCNGGAHNLSRALSRLRAEETVEGVLGTHPVSLLSVNGFGPTSMQATFLSLLGLGARLPAAWRVAPAAVMVEFWERALIAQDENPKALEALAKGQSGTPFLSSFLLKLVPLHHPKWVELHGMPKHSKARALVVLTAPPSPPGVTFGGVIGSRHDPSMSARASLQARSSRG